MYLAFRLQSPATTKGLVGSSARLEVIKPDQTNVDHTIVVWSQKNCILMVSWEFRESNFNIVECEFHLNEPLTIVILLPVKHSFSLNFYFFSSLVHRVLLRPAL